MEKQIIGLIQISVYLGVFALLIICVTMGEYPYISEERNKKPFTFGKHDDEPKIPF